MAKENDRTKQAATTKPPKPVKRPIPAPVSTKSGDKSGVIYR